MIFMVSVIIPAYNCAQTIGQCLASIFKQSFKDLEVIVVDDGSADDLASAIAPWRDKIKFFRQDNKGAPAARNFGFSQSRGEYVIFCDADIVMKPTMLDKMLTVLKKQPDKSFVYSSFKFGWKKFRLFPYSLERLKKMPFIPTTSLIRRGDFPGFDESLKKFQDWDLWLTIAERGGQGVWLDEVLFMVVARGTMSVWLPKIFYHWPWLGQVKRYQQGQAVIKQKHNL